MITSAPTLRYQFSPAAPQPSTPQTINHSASAKRRQKPHLEKVGNVTVPVYPLSWHDKKRRRTYHSYVIIYRDTQGEHREKRSSRQAAYARANEIANSIANGQIDLLTFTPADKASYQRARELLPPGKSLELAASEYASAYAQAAAIGDGHWTIADCIKFAGEHIPKGVEPKNIPALIADMLDEKRRHGKGAKWLGTLGQQLDKFSAQFPGALHGLRAHEISAWLDSLQVGLRSRKNYRDAVRELVRYAQAKGQLSRTWDEMSHVEDAAVPPVEVEIYQPDQVRSFLNARQAIEDRGRSGGTLIPFLALAFFAGIRHEEMVQRGGTKPVLDWSCIDLREGFIRIKATVGKTKRMRLIQMHPNLVEWLQPYAKASGPICELSQTAGALDRAKKLAKLPNQRGQLTNAARATYISCRLAETDDIGLVAREAGNSPQIIQRHYLELATPAQAAAHFGITPARADILPLFAWAKHAS